MTDIGTELSAEHCRARQSRVAEILQSRDVDRAIFVSPENIQYLTRFRPHRLMQAAVCLDADGKCTLAAPNAVPDEAVADEVVTFEAQWCATLRQEQASAAMAALAATVQDPTAKRIGIEFTAAHHHVGQSLAAEGTERIDLDAEIWRMRRRKDPDELAMIGRAIDCTAAMYRRAREVIQPGVTELEVFSELHAAAVEIAGEPLTALGNDYQCNSPGGPPRSRHVNDGELYILDLGPAIRGYYADNCRTIAVSGQPTDSQQQAWEAIVAVLDMVERTVRPGVSCRAIYEQAKQMLDEYETHAFPHHLGHGFGLYPHEAPHLNPYWDDHFEAGDVFTAEPGLYTDELRAGIRLEQNYRVTEDGVERLTNIPLEL